MPHDAPIEHAAAAPLEDHQQRLTEIERRLDDLAIEQSALIIEYTTRTQIVKLLLRHDAASAVRPCAAQQEAYG